MDHLTPEGQRPLQAVSTLMDDHVVLTDSLVALRKAAACESLSGSASRSLETTVELLELLVSSAPRSRGGHLAPVGGEN